MRIGCVVPRYGTEIARGAALQCRLIAERLTERHHVDVLTTCARDECSWRNEYAEGADRVRGVTVRRFATTRTRDPHDLRRRSDWLLTHRPGRQEEIEWLKRYGPWAPGLADYLERQHHQYDLLILFGALTSTSVVSLRSATKKVLVPSLAMEDDRALPLGLWQEVFNAAAAIVWMSEAERRFATHRFAIGPVPEDVIGFGVDLPEGAAVAEGVDPPAPPPGGREPFGPHIEGSANAFRRRHRLHEPFVLYGGRIAPGEGGEELFEYFQSYVKEGGETTLVLMGAKGMPVPEDPHVRFAGTLPDEERLHAYEAATVVIVPSPDDGPSMVALEALSVGTPVLGNARGASLVECCRASQGGLCYAGRWEFVEALKLLTRDRALRAALGRNGRAWVTGHARWDSVRARYEQLFAAVRGPGAVRPAIEPGAPDRDRGRGRDRGRDGGRDRDRQSRWPRQRGRPRDRDGDRDRDRDPARRRGGRRPQRHRSS